MSEMILRRACRVAWNVVSFSEKCREYPDKIIELVWNKLPKSSHSLKIVNQIGHLIYRRTYHRQMRDHGSSYTRFFRNQPHLEILQHIIQEKERNSTLAIAFFGCSRGAEVYSSLWTIRSSRPDLKVQAIGSDISIDSIEVAKRGSYKRSSEDLEGASDAMLQSVFVQKGEVLNIQPWLLEGIQWRVDDACDPNLPSSIGLQDIVFANNFICHLSIASAEACLRNLIRIVAPGGYLFVWGVNLDLKTNILKSAGFIPLDKLIEEAYKADQSALKSWPLKYYGLEPFDKGRPDWVFRYSGVFRKSDIVN